MTTDKRISALLAGAAAFFGALAAAALDGALTLPEVLAAVTAGILAATPAVAVPAVRAALYRKRYAAERDRSGRGTP